MNDCADEVYFLLEDFPRASGNVDQFVKSFFESTIDGHLSHDTPAVPTKKIRSATVRVLKGLTMNERAQFLTAYTKHFPVTYTQIMRTYWKCTMGALAISI